MNAGEEKKRATLDFGSLEADPLPSVDRTAIEEISHQAGYRSTPKAPSDDTVTIRRGTRRKTGRTEPFATRLRKATLADIYGYADRHDITLAETIERAMSSLLSAEQVK